MYQANGISLQCNSPDSFCFVIAKLCKEKNYFFKLICDSSRCMFYNKMWKGQHHQRKEVLFFSDFQIYHFIKVKFFIKWF